MIRLGETRLALDDVVAVAREGMKVELGAQARERMRASRAVVERAVTEGRVVYGVTTGFGNFADVHIPLDRLRELQLNLLRSHAAGVGAPLEEAETRALMLLRANVLAKGFSGVRLETLDLLIALLNARVHPVVPSQGSVGASGDLAPLAHLALALVGEGECVFEGRRLPGSVALRAIGATPLVLEPGVKRYGIEPADAEANIRAVVEAQMMSLALHSRWMGVKISTIYATGGASANRDVLQVMADVFDAEVLQLETGNSAALGAALRAFHADRLADGQPLPWEDVIAGFVVPRLESRLQPRPANVATYQRLIEVYAAREREALAVA